MQLKQAAGMLYVFTALVSGYWEFNLMLRPLIGGPASFWYPVTLCASVVLLIGGLLILMSRTKVGGPLALLAGLVLAAWWIPASVHTTGAYLSSSPPTPDLAEFVWTLVPGILILVSLIIGVALWKVGRLSPTRA